MSIQSAPSRETMRPRYAAYPVKLVAVAYAIPKRSTMMATVASRRRCGVVFVLVVVSGGVMEMTVLSLFFAVAVIVSPLSSVERLF